MDEIALTVYHDCDTQDIASPGVLGAWLGPRIESTSFRLSTSPHRVSHTKKMEDGTEETVEDNWGAITEDIGRAGAQREVTEWRDKMLIAIRCPDKSFKVEKVASDALERLKETHKPPLHRVELEGCTPEGATTKHIVYVHMEKLRDDTAGDEPARQPSDHVPFL